MKTVLFLFSIILSSSTLAVFPDVKSSHPHYEAINYLQENGIIAGNPDGSYRAESSISRAAFTKIIVETYFGRSLAESCEVSNLDFSDVPGDAWFAPYVCVAKIEGLIEGYPDNTFRPGDGINVAEASKIISAHRKGTRVGTPWYRPYIEDLAEEGSLPEEITAVEQLLNRGMMAEIIYRLKAKVKQKKARSKSFFFPPAGLTGAFDQKAVLVAVDETEASGLAKARYEETYEMLATFKDLIDPEDGFFYEGWIIRKGLQSSVISTGKAEKVDGVFMNAFTSDEDLSDHLEYVLTLEPDDGNPAPADHVVEGSFKKSTGKSPEPVAKEGAEYVEYSETLFNQLKEEERDFVLNFGASWCPNCRALDKKINEELSVLKSEAIIVKVDYDSSDNLKKAFKVTRQTTGVFFESGVYTETKGNVTFEMIQDFFK